MVMADGSEGGILAAKSSIWLTGNFDLPSPLDKLRFTHDYCVLFLCLGQWHFQAHMCCTSKCSAQEQTTVCCS